MNFNYLIWALVAIMYTPIFYRLYKVGWSDDYSHAYFIFPIVLWLIWRKRAELKQIFQNTPYVKNFFSLPVFLLGLLMFVFGWHQDYDFILTFSLIPLSLGLTTYIYGMNITKAVSFPLFYLIFLVPPPAAVLDAITLPMRHGVSVVAEIILRFFDYPITRNGLLITVGYNEIFMGAPCSGFRSLITMFSLVLAYVYISKGALLKKFVLAALIIPFALVGNVLRVITLCLITFYFGEEAGQGFFHNFS
ncbi:MAG: exosortase, partial [Nitrospirae bacterium]|nr:exosortase [Nitrospirota bacterium]